MTADRVTDVVVAGAGPNGLMLAARCAPDLVLRNENGPVRPAELTRGARPLLLDLTGTARSPRNWRARTTGSTRSPHTPTPPRRPRCCGRTVTWHGHRPRPDRAALHTALGRWFGAAA